MVAAALFAWRDIENRSRSSLQGAVRLNLRLLPLPKKASPYSRSKNLSSDPENAYFADGVQDEILTNVAQIADLKVISRTSLMQYKTGIRRNVFFTVFPLALWISHSFSMLVLAFVIRGGKEFGDTSRKALIVSYCEPQRRGRMVGTYYLIRDLLVSTGAFLGAYLWKLGPGTNFMGAAVLGAAGTTFYVCTTMTGGTRPCDHGSNSV